MTTPVLAPSRSLLRRYLVTGYALFIVYASLSPFVGWQEQGLSFMGALTAPLRQTYTLSDVVSNVLAYFPFGMLLMLTLATRLERWRAATGATVLAVMLSLTMEYLQLYLPNRTSSNVDVLANGTGAWAGAMLAALIAPQTWFTRLTEWRIGLFRQGAGVDFGLALVMLWMFGQVNPSLPMLGNVFITEVAPQLLSGVPDTEFDLWEAWAVALNLLMTGLLLLTLLRVRRHVAVGLLLMLGVVALTKFVAAALLLKSWALLLWLNSEAMLGILMGMVLVASMAWLPKRALVWGVASAALSYMVLAYFVLDSGTPSAAMRLYQWRHGHMRNYNVLSHGVSMLFPALLLVYLEWYRRTLRK